MLRIHERRATQLQVAQRLGISVRHVERLYRAYKTGGAAALVSKKRGRPSGRRLPDQLRSAALGLVRAHYPDFRPTLAHEKLTEVHGLRLSVETLRQWMTTDGLWEPRAGRRAKAHPPRRRRPCLGELVQIDGSDHEWFEERAPRCTLLVFIDDATGRLMHLRFAPSESTFDYFEATRRYLVDHGRPVAFYSDKASIFRVNAKQPRGGDGTTQFARALGELNIDILFANSPQAKGRVERANQTLQDRLVKELRLRNISDPDTANSFAPKFVADFNRRFAREPASPHDAHRPLRPCDDLEAVFRWKEQRRLTNNLVLHYKRSLYVVEDSPAALAARGQLVEVHETIDGIVRVRHRGHELAATPFRKDGAVRQQDVADNKHLGVILEQLRQAQIANDEQKLKERSTKRDKALLEVSLEARGRGQARTPTQPRAPSPPPRSLPPRDPRSNRFLASVLDRIKGDDWKSEIEKATPPRARSSRP